MQLSEINLSDIEGFWTEPMAVREAAFETLRREDPIRFFPEAETEYLAAGPGYAHQTRRHRGGKPSGHSSMEPAPTSPTSTRVQRVLRLDDQHGRSSTRSTAQARVRPGSRPHAATQHRRCRRRGEDDRSSAAEAGSGCDFVTTCAAWLPVKIICDMMGIPESQHEFVFDMTNIILSQGVPNRAGGTKPARAFLAPALRWPDSSMTLRARLTGATATRSPMRSSTPRSTATS